MASVGTSDVNTPLVFRSQGPPEAMHAALHMCTFSLQVNCTIALVLCLPGDLFVVFTRFDCCSLPYNWLSSTITST